MNVAATADAARRPPFSARVPRDSCSRQVCGSLEEVDQESKRVTPETERGGVLRLHARWWPAGSSTYPFRGQIDTLLMIFSGFISRSVTCENKILLRTAGRRPTGVAKLGMWLNSSRGAQPRPSPTVTITRR